MAEMNALAKRWVTALRSGQYEQGKYALRTGDDRYCCLGVLADVAAPDCWGKLVDIQYADNPAKPGEPLKVEAYMADNYSAEAITEGLWAVVTEGAPFPTHFDTLAAANDEGLTFEQLIQQYILPMWDDQWEGQEPSYD